MCGIVGLFRPGGADWSGLIEQMAQSIAHRGPDSDGYWGDPDAGIAFGHRRLAILDLSPQGYQPMHSASGRYVITFNGEIYNYQHLRAQLPQVQWRGTSDTEVILAAVEAWGVTKTLEQMVGMFAFGLWDRQERTLYLGRDRLGEKPLYYGWVGDSFWFGSELKPLACHPNWTPRINRDALALFMKYNCIPAPHTIYEGVFKLPPAHFLKVDGEPQAYWSAKTVAETPISRDEAIEALEILLKEAVVHQMIADVPLGAFLSGGLDSSTIVALMQAQSNRPVKTFSVGFTEKKYDEAPFASAVARHLQTDHTEVYVTPQEALAVIPQLPTIYDEPFADSSQIPTFLISQVARQQVTVALSGDGGDELFGGYTRYPRTRRLYNRMQYIPNGLQKGLSQLLLKMPAKAWDSLAGLETHFPGLPVNTSRRIRHLLQLLPLTHPEDLYDTLVAHWQDEVVLGAKLPPLAANNAENWLKTPDVIRKIMYLDLVAYLPDDLLVKMDRASMAVSLEVRAPLLDHRVVEFAQGLPLSFKIRHGESKWLLRQVLYKYVPSELVNRPKMGFSIPLERWLGAELRDWAENLLDQRRLEQDGILNAALIHDIWTQFLNGKVGFTFYLWDVLMFQAWKAHWMP